MDATTANATGCEWLLGELWSAVCDMSMDGLCSPAPVSI